MSKHINTELGQIHEWLNINKLHVTLNVSKTKFTWFHHSQRALNNLIPKILINAGQIERVSEFNFLGLTIDDHLNWKTLIQKVSNRIVKALGVMVRPKNSLRGHISRIFFTILWSSHTYNTPFWPGTSKPFGWKNLKRALRIITRSKNNAHT